MLYKSKKRKPFSSHLLTLAMASASLVVAACSNENPAANSDDELLSMVSAAGLTGNPTSG